jgi:hypothetical protein
MFIQLTNANADFYGQPIAIREDLIVTVYGDAQKGSTFLYAPPHGTWEVKEDYKDVIAMLNKEKE